MKPSQIKIILLFAALILCQRVSADELRIDTFSIEKGGEAEVAVCLEAEGAYTGFQMQIVLPVGLQFVAHGEEYAALPASDTSHIICSQPDGNTLSVVSFSTVGAPYERPAVLFTFKLKGDPDFDGGDILFTNIIFSTVDHHDVKFPDAMAHCEATPVATGLLVPSELPDPQIHYLTLDGRIVSQSQLSPGLYIMVTTSGNNRIVRKIAVR